MSQGRDALALAQRAVELTARATKAAGAYVYLWDRDEERLVLRAATEGWQQGHIGQIRLRIGEGLTGWSALMRQPVVVDNDPAQDPRSKPFPELRESAFKSMVAVPIVAPGEEVLGVFSLYALTEAAFRSSDVSLATEVGSLLASGLIQAETLTQLQVQSTAARFLHDLPHNAWDSLPQCLRIMAELCAADLDADLCLLEVMADRTVAKGTVDAVYVSRRLSSTHPGISAVAEQDKAALTALLRGSDLSRLRIPLGAPAPIGVVTVYRFRRFTDRDVILLEAIGAQVAYGALSLIGAAGLRPLRDQLLEAGTPETTEAMLLGMGWKRRTTTTAVLRVRTTATADQAAGTDRVRDLIAETVRQPGRRVEILGDAGQFVLLAETPDQAARDVLAHRLAEVRVRPGVIVSVGVGELARTLPEVHRSLRHSATSAHWATLIESNGVVRFEEVAHLRMLPGTALAMSSSLRSYLGLLEPVVDYDLANRTDLAQTLEVFFAQGGSVARASETLFIHRNTLRQRIQRIEELIGHSPETFEDWILAGLATRLARQARGELEDSAAGRSPERSSCGGAIPDESCHDATSCQHADHAVGN
ncbi:helix-turn-helix domain-containing protein [Nocardia jiangxiensis]|uniref:helix-turn-helix domain-containing protein n=1 Tax=Nocardia jiangxiensis TaxID=282685 RepID=UPI001FE153A1|nr:GAF domain-containing protein [Nocardia jiangxiensis]